jgi:hypothetical protein
MTSEDERCVIYFDKESRQIFIRKMSKDETAMFERL